MKIPKGLSKIACYIGLSLLMGGFLFFDSGTMDRSYRTFNFQFREALNRSPSFSGKLKILALDDHAVDAIGGVDLSPDQWVELLTKISMREPRSIVIDKIFSIIPGDQSQLAKISAAMSRTKTYVASSTSVVKSRWRTAFDDKTPGNLFLPSAKLPSFLRETGQVNLYGPAELLLPGLAGVGFISSYRFGKVKAAIRATDTSIAVHLGLLASGDLSIDNGVVKIGDRLLKATDDGHVSVNFPAKAALFDATYSLGSFYSETNRSANLEINKGDIVLILPMFFTGHGDFADTPIGRIPGGFVVASMLNSSLTNNWIANASDYKILTNISLAAVGSIAASFLSALSSFVFIVAFSAILALFGLLSFTYFGMEFPWLEGSVSFLIASLWIGGFRYWSYMDGVRRLRASFGGLVPSGRMSMMFDNWENIQRAPVERQLSVMFIDIVGFSVYADQAEPEEVFSTLRSQLDFLTKIIHKHGGIVDKSLGDGLLCFFGYDYAGKFVSQSLSDAAINCAIEIQTLNLGGILKETSKNLPLRIGINTATVLIGDLGNDERIDFTIIGSGVNLAQRFEAACEQHKIMVSETTIQNSSFAKDHSGFATRFIHVKHHNDLLKSVEINPLVFDPDLLSQFHSGIDRQEVDVTNREPRWDVFEHASMTIFVGHEQVKPVNFSKGGLQLKMNTFLAKGVTCIVKIKISSKSLTRELEDRGLNEICCEIRWGRQMSDQSGYLHGLAFKFLTGSQRSFLLEFLKGQAKGINAIKSSS